MGKVLPTETLCFIWLRHSWCVSLTVAVVRLVVAFMLVAAAILQCESVSMSVSMSVRACEGERACVCVWGTLSHGLFLQICHIFKSEIYHLHGCVVLVCACLYVGFLACACRSTLPIK